MKITQIDIIEAVMPFADGGSGMGITPTRWDTLDAVFVRLQTDTGIVGWGECFAYSCRTAVAASARDMIAPLVLGRELAATPEALNLEIQRKLHIFGRYGIAMYAISGFDIALWDIAAKAQDKPLHALLGPARRDTVPAYASLVRYGDAALVDTWCRHALARGYRNVKLHEVDPQVIRAGRAACGPEIGISVDVNCAWTPEQAEAWTREDWIAIVLSPVIFALLMIGVTKLLLLQAGGVLMVIAAVELSGVVYWVIDPKLKAVSAEYEAQQEAYVKQLEERLRWQDDGEAVHG